MNSLSNEGRSKISLWKSQYTINNRVSGNALLKIIIRESHIDTQATTGTIRTKLSSLDTYMPTVSSDIGKFNQYVQLLVDSLRVRGEVKDGLVFDLFKGYMACSDKKFIGYIERKQQDYHEGNTVTANQLMVLADNMYKLMKENGTWCAPSDEEEKIIALQAQVEALKKRKQARKTESPNKKKAGDTQGKPAAKEKPKWFTIKPSPEALTKPRKWDGKDWWWCSTETGGKCQGVYRRHKPSECLGKAHKFAPKKTPKKETGPKMKLAKALQATIKAEEEEHNETHVDENGEIS